MIHRHISEQASEHAPTVGYCGGCQSISFCEQKFCDVSRVALQELDSGKTSNTVHGGGREQGDQFRHLPSQKHLVLCRGSNAPTLDVGCECCGSSRDSRVAQANRITSCYHVPRIRMEGDL